MTGPVYVLGPARRPGMSDCGGMSPPMRQQQAAVHHRAQWGRRAASTAPMPMAQMQLKLAPIAD